MLFALALAAVSTNGVETQWIHNYPAPVQPLLRQWVRGEVSCRGESGDKAYAACDSRDNAVDSLRARGWCYGFRNQHSNQYHWHRCRPGSLGY